LLGDYNQNDTIDAADYTVWRDLFLVDDAILPNDPTPNVIDESDYEYWKDHSGESLNPPGPGSATSVPEPAQFASALLGLASFALASQFRVRRFA
jgi:hypothetical protein